MTSPSDLNRAWLPGRIAAAIQVAVLGFQTWVAWKDSQNARELAAVFAYVEVRFWLACTMVALVAEVLTLFRRLGGLVLTAVTAVSLALVVAGLDLWLELGYDPDRGADPIDLRIWVWPLIRTVVLLAVGATAVRTSLRVRAIQTTGAEGPPPA